MVPSALRRSRASLRLCEAEGGVLLGPRLATIPSLVPGLLARAGETRALLTPLAERILALSACEEAELSRSAPPSAGSARAAADAVRELRLSEVSAADLRRAALDVPGRPAERLVALSRALEIHEELLSELRAADAAAALRAAAEAARRGIPSEETADLGLLVLEGFLPPSPGALDLVTALAGRARRVLARVPYFPEDPRRSSPAEPWVRRIESLHELASRREVALRFPSDEERAPRIARALGLGGGRRDPGPEGWIATLPSPGDEEQAESAARFAADLLEGGLAPDEIAVVAPRRLSEALSRSFRRLAVPLSAAGQAPLAALPLVRDLRAALEAAGEVDRASAELLLRSPYLRAGEPPAGLGRMLDRAGALPGRGDPAERLADRAGRLTAPAARRERAGLLATARELRRSAAALAPLRGPATARGWEARVRAFAEGAGVRRRAARGPADVARRDLEGLSRFEEAMEEVATAQRLLGRGERKLDRGEWLRHLDLALRSASVPGASPAAGGGVELWPLEEAPGLEARAVLVLGAERGSWPSPPRTDPLLGDAARRAVNERLRRRALATSADRQAVADYLGFAALAAAREVLAVGFTRGAGGEGPAPLAAEVLARGAAEELPLASDPPLGHARSREEALRAVARLAPSNGEPLARALAALPGATAGEGASLAARASSAIARGELERERRLAVLEGRTAPSAGAIPGDLSLAFREALPEEWSATQLETRARCPYRLFLQLAGLPDAPAADLDMAPRDEGRLLHAVLESFLAARRARGAWPPSGDEEDQAELERIADEAFAACEAEGRVGDPAAWASRRQALVRRLSRWVEAEGRVHDGLRPLLVEHEFGGRSGSPPLAVPSPGGPILLRGRIDRVDADDRRLLVLDYKNSRGERDHRGKLDEEALGTTSFQPPLYLLAAMREAPGREELGVTYGLLRSTERVRPWRPPPGDGFLALDPARRAEVRAAGGRTFADAVVAAVGEVRAGRFPIASADCTGCPYGAVCRFPRPGDDA